MARVAEQAERFDDMVRFLREVCENPEGDFEQVEERNLLSVGFKNQISGCRTAIRTIAAIMQNPKYDNFSVRLKTYEDEIKNDLY